MNCVNTPCGTHANCARERALARERERERERASVLREKSGEKCACKTERERIVNAMRCGESVCICVCVCVSTSCAREMPFCMPRSFRGDGIYIQKCARVARGFCLFKCLEYRLGERVRCVYFGEPLYGLLDRVNCEGLQSNE